MAIRQAKIEERTPVEDVELTYTLGTSSKRSTKPRFRRGRMLGISKDKIELGSREAFHIGDTLNLVVHTKRVEDFMRAETKIEKCVRVTVFKQPAFCVEMSFNKLSKEQASKLGWLVDQFGVKERAAPIRRETPEPKPAEEAKEAPPVPAPKARETSAEVKPAARAKAHGGGRVRRPVALLELMRQLDEFDVTDDLIMAVLESAEAGMDVEVLFPVETRGRIASEETVEMEAEGPPPPSQARPINVYRLAANTTLHFSAAGMPAGPASEMFYLSRLESPETCFGIDLGVDSMTQAGWPSFKEGAILVFSTTEPVEDGDFAYMKMRGKDLFAQIFLPKADEVRIRFLNPEHPEQVAKRREVRVLCKLIGHYEPI